MELGAIIMMIIIAGGVWGAFIYSLRVAIRKEKIKKEMDKSS
ncbi:MAG: MetS family NSS transporter small subunit [Candidatus Aminicenantes bacterium]|nr:MetS family NSS transporter small subunit [Candidatus Aminicenantes bacterium]